MAISELTPTVPFREPRDFLVNWNPLEELHADSIIPPTVLINGKSDEAHQFAAELIGSLISKFPNMPIFVIPSTPANATGEIDKTTEVMTWLADTNNRGENSAVAGPETPIPLVYLSNVSDLYSETTLARMVKRARFLGLVVIAVASSVDSQSPVYQQITEMFTHVLEV